MAPANAGPIVAVCAEETAMAVPNGNAATKSSFEDGYGMAIDCALAAGCAAANGR